jgi:uncharacterized membrane protein
MGSNMDGTSNTEAMVMDEKSSTVSVQSSRIISPNIKSIVIPVTVVTAVGAVVAVGVAGAVVTGVEAQDIVVLLPKTYQMILYMSLALALTLPKKLLLKNLAQLAL